MFVEVYDIYIYIYVVGDSTFSASPSGQDGFGPHRKCGLLPQAFGSLMPARMLHESWTGRAQSASPKD